MTLRNFPPADQCSPEDLDAIADLVVRDPHASYDLAGSREHLEALCRRYQDLARSAALEADAERARSDQLAAADLTIVAIERALASATNDLDEEREMVADLKVRCAHREASLGDLASELLDELGSARTEIQVLQSTLDAERNERQGEVLQAEGDRERADAGEAAAEVFEATARSALARCASRTEPMTLAEVVHAVDGRLSRALVRERAISAAFGAKLEDALAQLEAHQQTHVLDDQLRSTCKAITGKTIEQVNLDLDAELAAHPDPGPLHHARDQRDHQGDTTP